MRYITVPKELTIDEVVGKKYSFSSQTYKRLQITNTNCKRVADLLAQAPQSGKEVGSLAYVCQSTYQFVRTKAVQSHQFCLDVEISGATAPIKPRDFRINVGTGQVRSIREGDIMFVTGGNVGEVAIAPADMPHAVFSSHMLKLSFRQHPLYTYAMLKHDLGKEQMNVGPIGAIAGLDSFQVNYLLDALIPFPTQPDAEEVIAYVESLTSAILAKEVEIRRKHALILTSIAHELADNQKPEKFAYQDPTIEEVLRTGRFDTSLYTKKFKQQNFTVLNYKHGHVSLPDRGFLAARGTSLEIKSLGTRLDSDIPLPGYYQLLIPANISDYGTQDRTSYIGTPIALKTIEQGDIIFGGEGFGKGRCLVVCEQVTNIATNYHGIRIYKPGGTLTESIFIRCFLSYWRSLGMIDYIGVGGSGGHCAPSYFYLIETPNFPTTVQETLAALYHTPAVAYEVPTLTPATFAAADAAFTTAAGITELDWAAKRLRAHLDEVLDAIARDVPVSLTFDFLSRQL
jgi:hypothetical protein